MSFQRSTGIFVGAPTIVRLLAKYIGLNLSQRCSGLTQYPLKSPKCVLDYLFIHHMPQPPMIPKITVD